MTRELKIMLVVIAVVAVLVVGFIAGFASGRHTERTEGEQAEAQLLFDIRSALLRVESAKKPVSIPHIDIDALGGMVVDTRGR